MSRTTRGPHVLVIVQNLSVPLDRRVWLECQALVAAGYRVSVVCPQGPGDAAREDLDGVRIHRYRPPGPAGGVAGYLWEFAYCWLRTAWLTWRVWRRERFDALQACNPPDTYWALARLFTRRGVRFVYDQHDLNPEVSRFQFGEPAGPAARAQFRALVWLKAMTYRSAHHVVASNDPDRRAAMGVAARRRAVEVLDLEPQRRRYVEVYDRLLGRPPGPAGGGAVGAVGANGANGAGDGRRVLTGPSGPDFGRRLVDVDDPAALREFALTRRVGGVDRGTAAR